jgi:hypothetical protein
MRRQSFVGDTMHQLYLQDKGPTIHAILEFEEKMELDRLKAVLQRNMVHYPRFSSRLDKSGHYWETVTINIDDHVNEVELNIERNVDDDGDDDPFLRSMELYVGSVLHRRFNPNIPLWEVSILSNPSTSGCFVLFRISHSIGDGIVLSSLMLSMAEHDDDDDTTGETHENREESRPSASKLSKTQAHENKMKKKQTFISRTVQQLISMIKFCYKVTMIPFLVLSASVKLICTFFGRNDIATAIKPSKLSDLGNVKLFARGNPISVPLMKEIAKAAAAAAAAESRSGMSSSENKFTVNDVLMAAIAGGVRRYSQLRRHPTGQVQSRLPVRFLSIVNTRSSMGMSNEKKMLADYAAGKFGNEFSHFVINMNVGPMQPSHRLKEVHTTMSEVKKSPEGIVTNYSNKLMWLMGGSWLLEKTTRYFFSKFQSFVSNLMAPQVPLKFAGVSMKYLYNCTAPMVYGCTFNVMSYNKNLIICVACDEKVYSI